MLASRNSKGTSGLVEALREQDCTLVSELPIGVDPGMQNRRGIVVAKMMPTSGLDPDYSYVLWDVSDWSDHPTKENRSRGVELSRGSYRLSLVEAIGMANERRMDLLTSYTWLIPGTDKLVPGCLGSR